MTEPVKVPRAMAASPAGWARLGDFAEDAFATLESRASGDASQIVPLPWPELAAHLGAKDAPGLLPGAYVLTGGTGVGKTQWTTYAALYAAQHEHPVGVFSLELGKVGTLSRYLGAYPAVVEGRPDTATHWSDVFRGDKGEINKVQQWVEPVSKLPLSFAFGGSEGRTAAEIGKLANDIADQADEAGRCGLVVLDFLQLVAGPEDAAGDALRERIKAASYAMRHLANERGLAVVLVSSVARGHYPRLSGADGHPTASHPSSFVGVGKESGEIEYSADAVLTLTKAPKDSDGHVWLAVAKLRWNTPRWLAYAFNGSLHTEIPGGEANAMRAEAGTGNGRQDRTKTKTRTKPAEPPGDFAGMTV